MIGIEVEEFTEIQVCLNLENSNVLGNNEAQFVIQWKTGEKMIAERNVMGVYIIHQI